MSNSKRPAGVTILAVVLFLVAIDGIREILSINDQTVVEWFQTASQADLANLGFNVGYTGLAVIALVGMWEMKRWAVTAFAGWAALLVVGLAIKDSILKLRGATESEWWAVLAAPAVLAVVLGIIAVALQRSMSACQNDSNPSPTA